MPPVIDFGHEWVHVTATVLVRTGKAILHTIAVNGLGTVGTCTVYDGVDNGGAVLAILNLDVATSISVQPITMTYDARISTGIFLEYAGGLVADLTVTFV